LRVKKRFSMVAALASVLLAAAVQAQVAPPLINYQGHLLDQNGFPFSGPVSMVFSIFDAATGDTALYTETQTITAVNGLFSAVIGSVTPIPQTLFDTAPPAGFLEIAVNGNRVGRRKRFGTVAYAFNSGNANITSVNAGAGLEASAGTGEVTLSIADDGVTSNKILDGTITADDLAANSVGSDEVAANAVGSLKISAGAVGSSEIAAGAVGTNELVDNLVFTSDFADGAVGSGDLANFVDLGVAGVESGELQVLSSEVISFVPVVTLSTFSSGAGRISTSNDNGRAVIGVGIDEEWNPDSGALFASGPNQNDSVTLTSLTGYPNRGWIYVSDNGTLQANLFVDEDDKGIVGADTKNFRMAHPHRADQEIWYAGIEGPEAAAYVRGTARLTNGRSTVIFPDHFQIVAAREGMTVLLTPLDASSKGLTVTAKSATGIEVAELRQGTGTYDFDWEVKSVRKGHENYRVLRSKFETMAAPRAGEIKAK